MYSLTTSEATPIFGMLIVLLTAVMLSRAAQPLVTPGECIQIPGPNPILTPSPKGAWDSGVIEASDAFKDFGTYYLYYHANSGGGYRLGVVTSTQPLGPFKRHGDKPVLDVGPKGSWDAKHVACALVRKEGDKKYLMWYSGHGGKGGDGWSIGLAAAASPLGPWKKVKGNPILKRFGYVGGVVKVGGKYHLYTAHPIDSIAPDYSPMSLALADDPRGPWTPRKGNPVLKPGTSGEWDDGGFSEAEVIYAAGGFHLFYGGAKVYSPRILTRESIGYAYSADGIHFTKYARNPIATREAEPNAAAYAEVHTIHEPPFIYLYHTLRYKKPWRKSHTGFPRVEDLGVQVLVTQRPFRLDMPLLGRATLAPKTTTALADCPPLCLSHVSDLALTVECGYTRKANRGLRIHLRSSTDGTRYDTTDLHAFDHRLEPGKTVRQTFELSPKVRFIKVLLENGDPAERVAKLKVTATLGG